MSKVGRNQPCPCGSGKKYKLCCLANDEQATAFSRKTPKEPRTVREQGFALAGLTFGPVIDLSDEEKRKAHTVVEFSMPFELKGLPDATYRIHTESGSVVISTIAKTRDIDVMGHLIGFDLRSSRPGFGFELDEDRWGRCSYSDVRVELPRFYPIEKEDVMLRRCVEAVNELVGAYTQISGRYHLDRLRVQDILSYNHRLVLDSSETPPTHVNLRESLISGGQRVIDDTFETKVNVLLSGGGPDLWQRFLIDAERAYEYEEYARTIIDSVVALEIVIYQYISLFNRTKGIPEDKTREMMVRIGLSGSLDVDLKQIAPQGTFETDEIAAALQECKGLITMRNNILHRGERIISENQARIALRVIPFTINVLLALKKDLEPDS